MVTLHQVNGKYYKNDEQTRLAYLGHISGKLFKPHVIEFTPGFIEDVLVRGYRMYENDRTNPHGKTYFDTVSKNLNGDLVQLAVCRAFGREDMMVTSIDPSRPESFNKDVWYEQDGKRIDIEVKAYRSMWRIADYVSVFHSRSLNEQMQSGHLQVDVLVAGTSILFDDHAVVIITDVIDFDYFRHYNTMYSPENEHVNIHYHRLNRADVHSFVMCNPKYLNKENDGYTHDNETRIRERAARMCGITIEEVTGLSAPTVVSGPGGPLPKGNKHDHGHGAPEARARQVPA
jgi:hypothetical protein